jgi:hypothetical protein
MLLFESKGSDDTVVTSKCKLLEAERGGGRMGEDTWRGQGQGYGGLDMPALPHIPPFHPPEANMGGGEDPTPRPTMPP